MMKDGGQDDDKNIVYDNDVEQDEINDLNKDLLHLRNGLGDNINDANNKHQYIEEGGILNETRDKKIICLLYTSPSPRDA